MGGYIIRIFAQILGQGSEKWIAQIAAILDKMPSVGQIRFRNYGKSDKILPF